MRLQFALSTGCNAVGTLAPQLAALLLLAPAGFGQFSLVYLIFAAGVSLGLSVVSEPWHMALPTRADSGWRGYATANAALAVLAAAATAVVCFVISVAPVEIGLAAIAVGTAVFRAGTRYFLVQQGAIARATVADATFAGVFAVAVVALVFGSVPRETAIFAAWAIGGVVSVMVLPAWEGKWVTPVGWVAIHVREIRRLLADSLLMDVGAIVTPFVVSPLLGLAAFGTYRALSNVTAPVRLILNPLRPVITGRRDIHMRRGSGLWWLVMGSAAVLGLCAVAVLFLIDALHVHIGVLTSLVPYSASVGVTVAANFVGHFAYIRARTRYSTRWLLGARIAQTVFMTVLPLTGVATFGLAGGIVAYSVASVLTAVVWSLNDYRPERTTVTAVG